MEKNIQGIYSVKCIQYTVYSVETRADDSSLNDEIACIIPNKDLVVSYDDSGALSQFTDEVIRAGGNIRR